MGKRWTAAQAAAVKAKAESVARQAAALGQEAKAAEKALAKAKKKEAAAKAAAEAGAPAPSKSDEAGDLAKKKAVRGLGDLQWADEFFKFAQGRIEGKKGAHKEGAEKFTAAIAISQLTGLRPEELAKSVQLAMTKSGALVVVIKGAKLKEVEGQRIRGIAQRTLVIQKKCPASDWLKQKIIDDAKSTGATFNAAGILPFVNCSWNKNTFRQQSGRVLQEFKETATFQGWPVKKQQIFADAYSPYIYRTAFAYEMIDSDMPPAKISAAMGHRVTDSIQAYARRRGKKTVAPVTSVGIGKNDQVICHVTKNVLFDNGGIKAPGIRSGWSPKAAARKPSGPKM